MTKFWLIFIVMLIVSVQSTIWQNYIQFQEYKQQYNKRYDNNFIQIYRFIIYLNNLEEISTLNTNLEDNAIYGQTQFSDLTNDEMRKMMGLQRMNGSVKIKNQLNLSLNNEKIQLNNDTIPDIWNWVQQGAVSSIKNQGSCGSCWSFSTAGNIESLYFLKSSKLFNLSEQQLIDCDKYNFGCSGGWPYMAMSWLTDNGGLQTQDDYPLRSNYSGPCQFNQSRSKIQIKGYINMTHSQDFIKNALYSIGPLSILLDFTGLFHYKSGVANPRWCSTWPDHALVLVGYGIQKEDYWLIKNSWGVKWGINGYFMLKRGENKCGINLWATTAILAQ